MLIHLLLCKHGASWTMILSVTFLLLFVILVIIDRWKDRKLQKLHSVLGYDAAYVPLLGQGHIFFGSNEGIVNDFLHQYCLSGNHVLVAHLLR